MAVEVVVAVGPRDGNGFGVDDSRLFASMAGDRPSSRELALVSVTRGRGVWSTSVGGGADRDVVVFCG